MAAAREVPAATDQPDDAYFDVMAQQAATHWWYRARRALVTALLEHLAASAERVLDVGCGTGDNFRALDAFGAVCGTDLSEYALQRAPSGAEGGTRVAVSVAEKLPVASRAVDLLTSMDVIEHLDDDVAALREYCRVLRAEGTLLLTVPAYQFLWSRHDEWAAHRRRYRASTLRAAVSTAGFEVLECSYFFSFLLPPAVLLRRTPLRRLVRTTDDEVGAASAPVARVMTWLAAIERWVVVRARVPFGLSIVLVARRPADQPASAATDATSASISASSL